MDERFDTARTKQRSKSPAEVMYSPERFCTNTSLLLLLLLLLGAPFEVGEAATPAVDSRSLSSGGSNKGEECKAEEEDEEEEVKAAGEGGCDASPHPPVLMTRHCGASHAESARHPRAATARFRGTSTSR